MKYKEKNWTILKKKDFLGQKKQAGAELEKKKNFGPKIDQFSKKKKKRDISEQKKSWGWA